MMTIMQSTSKVQGLKLHITQNHSHSIQRLLRGYCPVLKRIWRDTVMAQPIIKNSTVRIATVSMLRLQLLDSPSNLTVSSSHNGEFIWLIRPLLSTTLSAHENIWVNCNTGLLQKPLAEGGHLLIARRKQPWGLILRILNDREVLKDCKHFHYRVILSHM